MPPADTPIPSTLGQAPRFAGPSASDQSSALSELRVPAPVTCLISIFLLDCLPTVKCQSLGLGLDHHQRSETKEPHHTNTKRFIRCPNTDMYNGTPPHWSERVAGKDTDKDAQGRIARSNGRSDSTDTRTPSPKRGEKKYGPQPNKSDTNNIDFARQVHTRYRNT